MKHVLLILKNVILKEKGRSTFIPSFSSPIELQQRGEIDVCQIHSCENPADLFTKALPTSSFEKLVNKIGMRKLRDLMKLC